MKSIIIFAFLALSASSAFATGNAAAQGAPAPKEWTFLVFLNGDNNLDSYGTADMNEMAAVGSTADVNVLVLRDTASATTSTKLFRMEKGKQTLVKDYGKNIDMGDWHNLVDFFKFAKENYPAKKYLVDIWNHGAGWKKSQLDPIMRGISYDDNSGNHITTPQLGMAFDAIRALNDGKKIDVFGMDACLMEMAEVIYEVRNSVQFVAGSEQTEPGDGWYYTSVLQQLTANPKMEGAELATIVEREYAASYSGGAQGNQSVQAGVVSTEKLVSALDTFNRFVQYMIQISPQYKSQLAAAINGSQAYYYSEYKDLLHFIQLAKAGVNDPQFDTLANDAAAALTQAVVFNAVSGSGLGNSKGFSIWLPTKSEYTAKQSGYAELAWTHDTHWQQFLEAMVFPTTPVMTLQDVQVVDQNGDGFISAGEQISFNIAVNNDSPVAAQNVKAYLTGPAAVTSGVGQVDVGTIGQGDKTIVGLNVVLPANMPGGSVDFRVTLVMPGFGQLEKTVTIVVDPNYTVENYAISSPHDYPINYDKTWTITKSGAHGIRVHFARLETEKGYDFVLIYDKNDKLVAKYDGKMPSFWAPYVDGDTVKIELKSDVTVNAYGIDVDKIAY